MTQLSPTEAQPLCLTIELVPVSCWYQSLRSAIPRSAWDKLRRGVYAAYDYRCAICGADGRMNCHELWEYDEVRAVQTLRGFQAICDWCHHVKHIGKANLLAKQGKLDYQRVIDHFLQVNACDMETFERHRREAAAQWSRRNQYEWTTDLGEWQKLVKTIAPQEQVSEETG